MSAATLFAPPCQVIRRDGQRVPFDASRIQHALARAGAATGAFDDLLADQLTTQATRLLAHRWPGEALPIERIQDVVEQVLIAAGHVATARAYMAHRQRHATLRADRQTMVDVESSINEYT